ncbi:MAG TPA: Uma2 family endonuclease [Chloroflexota bacterium]|nr:Uma2 family endonuclease [Chloroflexota bacterium]
MALTDTRPAPLTYAQLLRLREKLDDHNRYEIIDGDLQVTPAPAPEHQWVSGHFYRLVSTHVWDHGLGMLFAAPLDVIFTNFSVVEPDIVYITAEQIERIGRRGIEEPPTLVIEVLSPSTTARDRGIKRELYERQGVPHYWLAHPTRRSLEVRERRGGQYELVATLTGNAEFRPLLFPGLVIPLREIWPPRSWRARQ